MKGRFILAPSSRDTAHPGREGTTAVGGEPHHIHNQEADSNTCLCSVCFLLLTQAGTIVHGMIPVIFGERLFNSVNLM